jgi:hypothetical protein
MTKTLEKFLATPTVNTSDNVAIRLLVTSQTNLALYIAYMLLVLTLFVGVFTFKGRSFKQAVKVWFILFLLTPFWFQIMQGGRDFGFTLTDLVNKLELPVVRGPFNDFVFDSPIIGIMLMGWALFWGLSLAMLAVSNEFWIVFVSLWFPVAFALSPIGPRTKKASDIILSIGITATVTSRPGMAFFLGAGEWAVESLPFGNTAFGAAVYTISSYMVAMVFYVVLIIGAYHGINAVEGSVRAIMAGSWASTVKNVVKVDINKWRRDQQALRPMPVTVVNTVKPGMSKRLKDEGTQLGKKAAVNGGAMLATAAGAPTLGLAIKTVGDKVVK